MIMMMILHFSLISEYLFTLIRSWTNLSRYSLYHCLACFVQVNALNWQYKKQIRLW
jgi:hypothetical protein